MSKEILQEIENTINANKDYKEHYHLNDYFEIEHIDKLVKKYKQLKEAYDKEKYLTDKLTKQLTDEYKNTEIQYKLKNEYKNIIDELERWLKGYWELLSGMPDIQEQAQMDILHEVSDKIKELKGNNNGKN